MTLAEFYLELVAMDNEKIERWFRQQIATNESYRRAFFRNFTDELQQLDLKVDGNTIQGSSDNARKLFQLEQNLPDLFERSGLDEYTEAQLRIIRKRLNSANTLWNQFGLESAKLSEIEMVQIPEVQEQLARVAVASSEGTKEAMGAMVQELVTYENTLIKNEAVGLKGLMNNLISKAGIMPRYAGSIANTALFSIDRTVRKVQADKAGLSEARYYGPDDAKTRPFCREHVGEVRSYLYWDNVPNGTVLLPVTKYGGGYSCRHQLVPYDPEWESIDWDG